MFMNIDYICSGLALQGKLPGMLGTNGIECLELTFLWEEKEGIWFQKECSFPVCNSHDSFGGFGGFF